MAAFYKLLLLVCLARAVVTRYEDCIFNMNRGEKDLRFDLTSLKHLRTMNFSESKDSYSINIKLCASNQQKLICDETTTETIVCLVKNKKKYETDIGSQIKEVKLNTKDQLFMSLVGNSLCDNHQNYTTDITFICNENIIEDKFFYITHLSRCKYNIELTSIAFCPVDDLDEQKFCEVSIPHSLYKFNLNPLRRLTDNYVVENQNRRFEVNICGRLNKNKCGGNITTICDISDIMKPEVYAVGNRKNDQLNFDSESRSLKLIQHQRVKKIKGRRIEIVFKCNENIPPEKTKPEFLIEEKNDSNVAYFEVATSVVCIPRMTSCEIFTNDAQFNLKPLHKRVGNFMVTNVKAGGRFYLNVCDYLNQYDEVIPTSCTASGKTSACYVDDKGNGIPIGSTQVGPFYVGNSILLNYTDGINCTINSLKWSTLINFTCSDESQLIHDSTNFSSCTHVFQWKTQEACKKKFERKDQCMLTHPWFSSTVYNMSDLKYQNFEVNDDNAQFRFSICSPLQIPCNGNFDAGACFSVNGTEINIGIYTEQLVFDDGKLYMSMKGDKCVDGGPSSLTTIRFVCDFLDSKLIEYNKIEDLTECKFDFIIFTKNACTQPLKINCTVNDTSGNIFDLSQLTKFRSNYEVPIGQKKKIVLNVCHSVVNNDINAIDCQFSSGVCVFDPFVDSTNLLNSNRYKNLGDVNKSPYMKENKIILEMTNGFYKRHSVSSVIEFVCSLEKNGPVLKNDDNYIYTFQWFTPLACATHGNKKELIRKDKAIKKNYFVITGELNYSIYLCPKNEFDIICNLENDLEPSKPERSVMLFINEKRIKYPLTQNLQFTHHSYQFCNQNNTVSVKFSFICGFELLKPKIKRNGCVTNILFIDPEICDKKLECRTNIYDLTPLKGYHVVINETIKYYINFCVPGKEGVGVIKEFNQTNYTMGYQTQSPEKDQAGVVQIVFKHGDYKSDDCLNENIKPKIKFECDNSILKGKPMLMNSNNKCMLEFVWKTSLVCRRKLIQISMNNTCLGIINDYNKNFVDNKIIHLNNILKIDKFLDYSTNVFYRVHICNGSICNGLKCYGNMTLQYDIYQKQLIASFKNTVTNLTKVEVIITCPKASENLLQTYQVSSTDNFVSIITYSSYVCCMNLTSEEMCENYGSFTTNSPTSNLVDLVTSSEEEQIEVASVNPKKNFTISLSEYSNITITNTKKNYSTTDEEVSDFSFFSGKLLMLIVLALLSVLWFYRWSVLKGMQKMFNNLQLTRRRFRTRLGTYHHDYL